MTRMLAFSITASSVCLACSVANAQSVSASPPRTFTAEQDHQNVTGQLGIRKLHNGLSGDQAAPNHAHYDKVNQAMCASLVQQDLLVKARS